MFKCPVGLIMESAEIVGVAPGSPAAQAGVASIGTLTEVNGRPLNLLMKKVRHIFIRGQIK